MNIANGQSTYKKLILLIGIFIFGFISLFAVNKIFTNLVNELDKKTKNLEAKIVIGEFIAYDIVEIRSLFHELATTTSSKRSRDRIIKKIKDTIETIEDSLLILEKGGSLKRFIALNIAGHLNTTRVVSYRPAKKDDFSLEVIDIRPKMKEISQMLLIADKLLENRLKAKKASDMEGFIKSAKKIRRYYKTLPAYFIRISENIRRLLYEGEIELETLRTKINKDKQRYMQLKLYLILFVISIVVSLGYVIAKRVNKDSKLMMELNVKLNQNLQKQEKQKKYTRAILDAQPNIILVTDGENMLDANIKLSEFFPQYNTFEEFKKEHSCICDFFESKVPDEYEYINKIMYGKLTWLEYVKENQDRNFKVIMKKNGIKYYFDLIVNYTSAIDKQNNAEVIVTLNDITKEIKSQIKLKSLNDNLGLIVENKTKELQELNDNLEQKVIIEANKVREKDKQMIQQARFAALGEMIGNIAHQWRQPLSAINTTASGMQLQMQLDLTNEEEITDSYSKIMGYVEFLTQTIEDFRGFFKEDKEKIDFNIIDIINKSLTITNAAYKDNDIKVIKYFDNAPDLISFGMPSELSQVLLNVLNNAKDATVSNNIKNKFVHISTKIEKKQNIIYIQDNAGGIPADVIDKIFDPYFTTKHQSQGTGIGLYMSKDIIEKHMDGKISVKNITTTLDGKNYDGACFRIQLPLVSNS